MMIKMYKELRNSGINRSGAILMILAMPLMWIIELFDKREKNEKQHRKHG